MTALPLRKPRHELDGFDSVHDTPGSLRLQPRLVEKPWGRDVVGGPGLKVHRRIGEIWFEHPMAFDLPLLVKQIFTSEKLSVQVHPNDEQARERGFRNGKTECWYVLDAEPGASIGLGLRAPVSASELRTAALDGSIEHLLDWKPVARGDFFYVPAGTIHAIGAGISVLELQQNADVTYRLYDYGRPRELHLAEGIAVSKMGRNLEHLSRRAGGSVNAVLHDGPHFCLVRTRSVDMIPPSLSDRLRWVIPLEGNVWSEGEQASVGECLLVQPRARLSLSQSALVLLAAEGSI